MAHSISRRKAIAGMGGLIAATAARAEDAPKLAPAKVPFGGFCLNTSTVRTADGKSRSIVDLIAIAAKAGYAAIEPWISELDEYTKGGGTLADLKKRIADAGLVVPNAIGFAEWIVEDDARRKKGLEQAKLDMDKVLQIGGSRMAAPPTGATGGTSKRDDPKYTAPVELLAAADRYRALFDIGKERGVTPIVEVWGFSRTLSRLGETLLVAAESGRDGGAILPDIYHLYKGGSDFTGLNILGPKSIGIFHVNDYPKLDRTKIGDADRVFPGDGIAPMKEIFTALQAIGYRGFLSLELFNRTYWKQEPNEVAKTGLEKLKAVIATALAG